MKIVFCVFAPGLDNDDYLVDIFATEELATRSLVGGTERVEPREVKENLTPKESLMKEIAR